MSINISTLEPGEIALIQQQPDGRICQIGLTVAQSKMLQTFLAILSKESPLVKMSKEYDLKLATPKNH